MCDSVQQSAWRSGDSGRAASPAATVPRTADEALGMVMAGFSWLADADLAGMPASVRAECLRRLERARSVQTAAHAAVLSAFDYEGGYVDDGQGTSRSWLRWQSRVTRGAASGAVGWMRRLRRHVAVADALRAARISASWAKQICDWTDLLPETARQDADVILLAAAAGGAELADLASLVEQMRRKLARPDQGDDDGFGERRLRLVTTIGGAGKLDGDLTPGCAAALQAVLDALATRVGPEDTRTGQQRQHDALDEACRRLIGSDCLPDRAGQPTQIQLHISLEELARRLAAAAGADADADRAGAGSGGTWADVASRLWPRLTDDGPVPPAPLPGSGAAPGDECDATIVPIVTGRVDHDLLSKLTAQAARRTSWSQRPPFDPSQPGNDWERIRDLILANAVALLSGPGGLASVLRTGALPPPAASVSLPLDAGKNKDTIPPHLRRAVILRDRHCAAPGCDAPPSACQVHHLIPRSKGGRTKLTNMILLCTFHHLIMVHRWGWTITLNRDGTTSARGPHGQILHSHSPPAAA